MEPPWTTGILWFRGRAISLLNLIFSETTRDMRCISSRDFTMETTQCLDLVVLLQFSVTRTKEMFRLTLVELFASMELLVMICTAPAKVHIICLRVSLVFPGKNQECRATGPGGDKDIYGFESTRIIGEQQFRKVRKTLRKFNLLFRLLNNGTLLLYLSPVESDSFTSSSTCPTSLSNQNGPDLPLTSPLVLLAWETGLFSAKGKR